MKRIDDVLSELEQLRNSVAKTVKRVAPPAKAPEPPPASTLRRSHAFHAGIDYGTASSKLVLRDYQPGGSERAHVVFPSSATGRSRDFRIPSIVCVEAGRLWFGIEAAARQTLRDVKVYPSIKTRMAAPGEFRGLATPLPEGMGADDLVTLMVAYLLQEAQRAVDAFSRRLQLPTPAPFSFTLGVPMSQLDRSHLRARFTDVARAADEIVKSANTPDLRLGIPVLEGWMLASNAAEAISRQPSADAKRWVRPEVEAALLWPYRSWDAETGIYAAVDVGAGTTGASFFHIVANGDSTRHLAVFSTSCDAPGTDAVDEALVGFSGTTDPSTLRSKENATIARVGEFAVTATAGHIARTYQRAFDRAWEKNAKAASWDGYRLFLTGGGSEIDVVRRKLSLRAGPKLRSSPQIIEAGTPTDLDLEGASSSDLKYLNVAYGLSFFDAEVPQASATTDAAEVVLGRPAGVQV
jgi:hypothetical protein